jgi:TatD DNase family protein
MPEGLCDAHVHLADPLLTNRRATIEDAFEKIGLCYAILAGTHPDDWQAVLELAATNNRYLAGIGLHPQRVTSAPPDWKSSFTDAFNQGAQVVNEIGLDFLKGTADRNTQIAAFEFQLQFAAQRNLPVSIHLLNAMGPFMEIIRASTLPPRGFHLHAFNGPLELIDELSALGAYFSFNGGQLHHQAAAKRINRVLAERILLETDAPNFFPMDAYREFELNNSETKICHPGNIQMTYLHVAKLRKESHAKFTSQVLINFERFFLR